MDGDSNDEEDTQEAENPEYEVPADGESRVDATAGVEPYQVHGKLDEVPHHHADRRGERDGRPEAVASVQISGYPERHDAEYEAENPQDDLGEVPFSGVRD